LMLAASPKLDLAQTLLGEATEMTLPQVGGAADAFPVFGCVVEPA